MSDNCCHLNDKDCYTTHKLQVCVCLFALLSSVCAKEFKLYNYESEQLKRSHVRYAKNKTLKCRVTKLAEFNSKHKHSVSTRTNRSDSNCILDSVHPINSKSIHSASVLIKTENESQNFRREMTEWNRHSKEEQKQKMLIGEFLVVLKALSRGKV